MGSYRVTDVTQAFGFCGPVYQLPDQDYCYYDPIEHTQAVYMYSAHMMWFTQTNSLSSYSGSRQRIKMHTSWNTAESPGDPCVYTSTA